MNKLIRHWFVCFMFGTVSCENSGPERDFERMVNQSYFLPYKECDFFPDKRSMREPPEGTLSISASGMPVAVESGMVDESYVEKNPVLLTAQLLALGQRRFDVFCAPCHGILGDGTSVVARKMTLRPPPSIVSERIRQFPDGRIFAIISEGYGLMPNYAHEMQPVDRWAIVAYVRALGIRAAGIPMDRLPFPVRQRAEEVLQ
jgi:Cytochrome C oxidase, cbb3-type, subunit III